MDCKRFSEMLDSYDDLSENERAELKAHSEECAECKRELELTLSIRSALRTLPKIEVPSDFADKVNERIDREDAMMTRRSRVMRYVSTYGRRYSAAAAALILAVVVGIGGKPIVETMRITTGVVSDTPEAEESPSAAPAEAGKTESALPSASKTPASDKTAAPKGNVSTAAPSRSGTVSGGTTVTAEPSEPSELSTQAKTASESTTVTAAPREDSTERTEVTAAPAAVSDEAEKNTEDKADEQNDGYVISGDAIDTYAYADSKSGDQEIATKSSQTINISDYHFTIDGMITVHSDSYDDAITIIAKYVSGASNGLYMASIEQFNSMISELSERGVSFDSSIMPMSDVVSFKVIVLD